MILGKELEFPKGTDPFDVAALLKDYLRDLPEPVTTFLLYPEFLVAFAHAENKILSLKQVLNQLQIENRYN